MTASAVKVTEENKNDAKQQQEAWQLAALAAYETCGEINFCARFYARMLARVRFFPVSISDTGERKEVKDGPAAELLNDVQDPGGGRTRIQYDYGRLMFITGEGALFVSGVEENEKWRFLWRGELETTPEGTFRKNAAGARTGEAGTAYRMWTPSPRNSDLADSPLRGVLEVAEELAILTGAVKATGISRMLNGMLVMPTEAMPPPPNPGNDDDPNQNPFLAGFIQHVMGQIEDPASAAAKIPYLLVAAYEYLDQVRWIQMHDPASDYLEKDLRDEAIKRLALGLDMPPEALEGFSNTNHWAAQQIQWDMWRSHGVPLADQFCADMSDVYLRPSLVEQQIDPRQFGIGYDDSQVVISPDQTAVADQAMDRVAISFAGYRQLKGIPEDFAPSEEEKAFVAGIKMRDPVVAGLEEQAPPVHGPTPDAQVGPDGQSNVPPPPANGRVASRQDSMVASITGEITGAARMAIRQCRSKAGARLRTAVSQPKEKCPECQQAIDGIPNSMVASALGADSLQEMAMRDPINLVRGGTEDFRACLEEWRIGNDNASVLCERLEAWAAKTLFEPNTPDLPPGFASHIEHALEVADNALVHQ